LAQAGLPEAGRQGDHPVRVSGRSGSVFWPSALNARMAVKAFLQEIQWPNRHPPFGAAESLACVALV
jgi:hypothetical protein